MPEMPEGPGSRTIRGPLRLGEVELSALRVRRRLRRVGELVGLVDERHGDLLELVTVLPRVVGAEQELATGLELYAEVGLSSATVAAVRGGERRARGNCSGHDGLISRSVS
jgi:hypothetical protein